VRLIDALNSRPADLSIQPRRQTRSLLTQTRQLLRQASLRARKRLGQHFLVDGGVLKHILSAAELSPNDIVIEVGPGLGVLTRELARQAGWVVAVELDDNLASLLKETLASFSNVTIVNQDILKVDPQALLQEHFPGREGDTWHYKVVANLPYYITSPVLRHFLEASLKPRCMVVMVQKEVAREITAQPGRLSLLGIGVQLYGEPKIVKYVRASSFYPAPEVDSAILRIAVYPRPMIEVDTESFFPLVRAGFSAARKQIANSLAHGLGWPKAEVLPILEKAGIDSRRRAETLSIEEWARLWREYARANLNSVIHKP
jgi:16S rRNA (adenine1518-N6/adenine1519-N6)-dimethyltransferase